MLGKFLFTRHRKERKEEEGEREIKERKDKGGRDMKGDGGVVRLTSFLACVATASEWFVAGTPGVSCHTSLAVVAAAC
jgi:hypothetical protein